MAESNHDTGGGSSVIINLVADNNIQGLRKRTITLTESNHTIPIGRASKVTTKGFVASTDNAWFDSPVMSRNHAEIVADFEEKSVFIRDVGSLHGTFLNNNKTKLDEHDAVTLNDGCSVTFGVPIVRNSESFAPATITVGITHKPAQHHQSPAPGAGATFALPEYVDDESSSPSSSEDESEGQDQDYEDLTELTDHSLGGKQIELVDLTDKNMPDDMDRVAHNLIDLTSPVQPASPVVIDGDQDHEQEHEIMQHAAMILDKIVDNSDNRSEGEVSSIAPPSMQDFESEAESDGTDKTDSDIVMSNDRSDDDEGSESENENESNSEKADWEAEYSSDDDVLDEEDPDTAVWGPVQEPVQDHVQEAVQDMSRNTQPFAHDGTGIHAAVMHNDQAQHIPPVSPYTRNPHPVAFGGPYPAPYYPMSNRYGGYNPDVAPQVRPASPSDAALPKRTTWQATHLAPGYHSYSTTEAPRELNETERLSELGKRTGKLEFFSALAENKRRAFAPSQYDDPARNFYSRCVEAGVTTFPGAAKSLAQVQQEFRQLQNRYDELKKAEQYGGEHAEERAEKPLDEAFQEPVDLAVEDSAEKPIHDSVQKPAEQLDDHDSEQPAVEPIEMSDATGKPASGANHKAVTTNQATTITPLLRTGDEFLNRPVEDLELPSLPGDNQDEPISAYELQKRKMAAQKGSASKDTPLEASTGRRTYVSIPDLVGLPVVPVSEPQKSAPVVEKGKGKRKADEMAELTQPEIEWAQSETRLMGHLRAANQALVHGQSHKDGDRPSVPFYSLVADAMEAPPAFPLMPEPHAPSVDSSTRAEQLVDGMRAPKRLRLRKIAERLGYAALGGATVGAALVSTLIYTAPTFT